MDGYDTASRRIAISHVVDAQRLALDVANACAEVHREALEVFYAAPVGAAAIRAALDKAARLHAALGVVLAHCEGDADAIRVPPSLNAFRPAAVEGDHKGGSHA